MSQIGHLEDVRLRTLQGITRFQALYKGYKTRCIYKKRRAATIFLQSRESHCQLHIQSISKSSLMKTIILVEEIFLIVADVLFGIYQW